MGGLHHPPAFGVAAQAAQGERPVHHRHHDTAGGGWPGPVHHQQIPVVNPLRRQGVAADANQKRALRVADQMVVQTQVALDKIVGGGGEAGRDRGGQQRPAAGGFPGRAGSANRATGGTPARRTVR